MTLPPPQTQEFVDRLTSLAVECREELSRSTQAIQEIDLLLRQTQQEIDRLSQRESQQSAKIREMESSLESFSRTEIREAFVAAHEVQMRLFMMRSQIEQLESRRDSISSLQQKLRILLDLAEINQDQYEGEAGDDRTRILPGTTGLSNDIDLGARIIETRESERARIAQSLTDGPAQVMSNVVLRTQILERVVEQAPDQLVQEIEDLERLASDSLLNIRRSVFEMRPLVLDELGLVSTLRRYSGDFTRETGAKITISGVERAEGLDGHLRIALFRLIQAALSAVVAPNEGTEVEISVTPEEAQLVVRIDATPVSQRGHNRVGHFVEDDYNNETLELIGASLQREMLPDAERLSIIVPIATNM
ncbi:MAG: histidine kinase [Thermomicrobiales bacterium]